MNEVCDDGKREIRSVIAAVMNVAPSKLTFSLDTELIGECCKEIPYAVVVPLDDENGHDYSLRVPVVLTGAEQTAVKRNGEVGNHLPGSSCPGGTVRMATKKEIRKFVLRFPTTYIEYENGIASIDEVCG